VRSPVWLWRSLVVSSLGSLYRPLHVTTRELLRVFTKFDTREFRERFLRHCYFTTGQIGLQWILSEPYNKKPGAWGLPIYFTRSNVDYILIIEPDAEKCFDILRVKVRCCCKCSITSYVSTATVRLCNFTFNNLDFVVFLLQNPWRILNCLFKFKQNMGESRK
jgi:hypothetical protein